MKTKSLALLLSLSFLFFFSSSSVVVADDLKKAEIAFEEEEYKTAYKLLLPLAEQGNAKAQSKLGDMYFQGKGVHQDYVLAHMWFNLAAASGDKDAIKGRTKVQKRMVPSIVVKAQEMARNWKPKK